MSSTPPASRIPLAVLDSQAFPHILDLVRSFASPEALLILRCCSRALRERADAALSSHLEVIFPCNIRDLQVGDDFVVSVSPHSASFRYEWCHFVHNPTGAALVHQGGRTYSPTPPYIEQMIQSALVIDIPGADQIEPLDFDLSQAYLSISDELQFALIESPNPDPTVRVIGGLRDLNGRDGWSWEGFARRPWGETTGPGIVFGYFDGRHRFSRFVRVLKVTPGLVEKEWAEGRHGTLTANNESELVIHLLHAPTPPLGPEGSPETASTLSDSDSEPIESLGFWNRILLAPFGSSSNPAIEVTVVGGAHEIRSAFGLRPTASALELEIALQDAIDAMSLNDVVSLSEDNDDMSLDDESGLLEAPDGEVEHLFDYLRFLTPEEYAAEVGEYQFALETMEDPYHGSPAVYLP